MLREYIVKQTGVTLIEILASLLILTMVSGIAFGVLMTSISHNDKTQSHVYLRQEANIIVTCLRQGHQSNRDVDSYRIHKEELIKKGSDKQISFKSYNVNDNESDVDPSENLIVQFELEDENNNTFEIDTVIEGSGNLIFTLPSDEGEP